MGIRIALALCVLLLSGCVLVDTSVHGIDPDVLINQSCAGPCVPGVSPGVTTQSDAWKTVNSNASLSDCRQHDLRLQGGVQWIDCNTGALSIVFDNDVVAWVTIIPDALSVKQVVQRYGPPDHVVILPTSRPDEPYSSKAILAYNQMKLEISLVEKPGKDYDIAADTQVKAITMNSEKEQVNLLTLGPQPWNGYHVYSP